MAKVSIIVPVYNMERYLRQCLDSIAKQTLTDIEVICVNDGSIDSSPDIIREYMKKDPRFKMIHKGNSGYGASMNQGLDKAEGEYIGIVESDDFIEPDMFEKLYACAKESDLDVCKAGFYYYYSSRKEKDVPCPLASWVMCREVFCPTTYFESLREQIDFFDIKPTIWSAIYKREFIRESGIRFNETPGASFQDTAFNFKVWAMAKRVKFLEDCLLHYRQDNENSSINSPGKIYCVCDEYAEMERFLDSHPELDKRLKVIKTAIKYDTYIWNYDRLSADRAREFLIAVAPEFKRDMDEGICIREAFSGQKWGTLNQIIADPEEAHTSRQWERALANGEISFFKRAVRCIKMNGIFGTAKKIIRKCRRVFNKK